MPVAMRSSSPSENPRQYSRQAGSTNPATRSCPQHMITRRASASSCTIQRRDQYIDLQKGNVSFATTSGPIKSSSRRSSTWPDNEAKVSPQSSVQCNLSKSLVLFCACGIELIIQSKPDEYIHCLSIKAAHQLYLIISFFDVTLLDTQSIDENPILLTF